MSYNGSGVYTLPGAQLANGEIVSATENNQFRNDVAAALNIAWTRDGQAPATANIPMGSHKLTGLAAGTGAGDSVRYEQFASPPAIGGTAAAAGSFTTLTTSSTVTVSGGTANGVAYLNGSKVLTTGSALTFDGTNFATTGTASATKLIPTGGDATGNGMYLPASNTLAWSNNGSETMRLDSSGNLLVGGTTSGGTGVFSVIPNSQGVGASPYFVFNKSGSGGLTQMYFQYNGSTKGSISYSDTATSFNTTSDYRLKQNIQPMQNALATVSQLNPVTYIWKENGSAGQGFIAHELQAVVPDCVTGEKDAVDENGKPIYQGVDTSFLVATLVKAIQELKAELDATKAEVAALKQGA